MKIIRFRDRLIFEERTIREVAAQIAATLPADDSVVHLVLDFNGVALISSSFVSKLLLLKRRIDASGGTLRLCRMARDIEDFFQWSHLDRLFQIEREQPSVSVFS